MPTRPWRNLCQGYLEGRTTVDDLAWWNRYRLWSSIQVHSGLPCGIGDLETSIENNVVMNSQSNVSTWKQKENCEQGKKRKITYWSSQECTKASGTKDSFTCSRWSLSAIFFKNLFKVLGAIGGHAIYQVGQADTVEHGVNRALSSERQHLKRMEAWENWSIAHSKSMVYKRWISSFADGLSTLWQAWKWCNKNKKKVRSVSCWGNNIVVSTRNCPRNTHHPQWEQRVWCAKSQRSCPPVGPQRSYLVVWTRQCLRV